MAMTNPVFNLAIKLPYFVKVDLADKGTDIWELSRWCSKNVGQSISSGGILGKWYRYPDIFINTATFRFKNEKDLVAFKLTWC